MRTLQHKYNSLFHTKTRSSIQIHTPHINTRQLCLLHFSITRLFRRHTPTHLCTLLNTLTFVWTLGHSHYDLVLMLHTQSGSPLVPVIYVLKLVKSPTLNFPAHSFTNSKTANIFVLISNIRNMHVELLYAITYF